MHRSVNIYLATFLIEYFSSFANLNIFSRTTVWYAYHRLGTAGARHSQLFRIMRWRCERKMRVTTIFRAGQSDGLRGVIKKKKPVTDVRKNRQRFFYIDRVPYQDRREDFENLEQIFWWYPLKWLKIWWGEVSSVRNWYQRSINGLVC